MKLLSVVVSVYNEEAVINKFHETVIPILESLPCRYEILYVNDGSSDASEMLLNHFAKKNDKVKTIHFSRNFGHEAAMIAGIDYAKGDYIVCMDADLQHPPEMIGEMLKAFEDGNDIVLMARQQNKDAGWFKNLTSPLFYKLLNWLGDDHFEQNVSDFFGMSRLVAEIFRTEYREKRRYLRGYIQHIGFQKKVVNYVAAPRFAGESKYSLKRLMNVFVIAVVNFSKNLVRVGFAFSFIVFLVAAVFLIYSVVHFCQTGVWSVIGVLAGVLCLMFSLQFILMGITGEYIGAILSETNRRPVYIVKDMTNIEKQC